MYLGRPFGRQPGNRQEVLRVAGPKHSVGRSGGKRPRWWQTHPAGREVGLRVNELLHDRNVAAEVLVVVDCRLVCDTRGKQLVRAVKL